MRRRSFLLGAGLVGATAWAETDAQQPMAMPSHPLSPSSVPPRVYVFFNTTEAVAVEALVDTLIPADETGPGALELDVSTYIDRQLAGAFGQGARRYMQGPFATGTPQQGWQIAMTPAELFRVGLADLEAAARSDRKAAFADLPVEERIALLQAVEAGKVAFATAPAALFFGLALSLVYEGYFGDPIHGGNRGLGSWKMIGFPGAGGMYADKIEPYRNRPYTVEPRGIGDLS